MVEVKQAVQNAVQFLQEIIPDDRVKDALVEEVELSDDQKEWRVTVSLPQAGKTPLSSALSVRPPERDYKLVEVDSETGEARAIRIRKL